LLEVVVIPSRVVGERFKLTSPKSTPGRAIIDLIIACLQWGNITSFAGVMTAFFAMAFRFRPTCNKQL